MPGSGRNSSSQRHDRSAISNVAMVSPTNSRISGPLIRMPAASAVQNTAGRIQPASPGLMRLLAEIDPRHRAHRRDDGRKQHGVGLGEPRLDAEQDRARHHQSGQHARRGATRRRAPPNRSAAPRRSRRSARQAIEPDRGQRVALAERVGGFDRAGLQPVDADRLLVAGLVLEPDVDVVARSRSSAWWPGRSAPRRDRSAESENCPGRKASSAATSKHRDGARVRGHGEVDHRLRPLARQRTC